MNSFSYNLDGEQVTIVGISIDRNIAEQDEVYVSYITSAGQLKTKEKRFSLVNGIVPDTISL